MNISDLKLSSSNFKIKPRLFDILPMLVDAAEDAFQAAEEASPEEREHLWSEWGRSIDVIATIDLGAAMDIMVQTLNYTQEKELPEILSGRRRERSTPHTVAYAFLHAYVDLATSLDPVWGNNIQSTLLNCLENDPPAYERRLEIFLESLAGQVKEYPDIVAKRAKEIAQTARDSSFPDLHERALKLIKETNPKNKGTRHILSWADQELGKHFSNTKAIRPSGNTKTYAARKQKPASPS